MADRIEYTLRLTLDEAEKLDCGLSVALASPQTASYREELQALYDKVIATFEATDARSNTRL